MRDETANVFEAALGLARALEMPFSVERTSKLRELLKSVSLDRYPQLDWTTDAADEVVARVFGAAIPRSPLTPDGERYEPTPARSIVQMVDRLNLGEDAVFVDIGCGRGLLLALLHALTNCTVIGIESDPVLAREAARTLERWAGQRSRVMCVDAVRSTVPPADVFFLFNPFADTEDFVAVYRSIRTVSVAEKTRVVSLGATSEALKAEASFRGGLRHLWGGGNTLKSMQCHLVLAEG